MIKHQRQFYDVLIEALFDTYPDLERQGLLQLRDLIFQVAGCTKGVGKVSEALKWGQPAYLTPDTKAGPTIRLGLSKSGGFAIYVHCQTTILSDFKQIFPVEFAYERNRAIHFRAGETLPLSKLEILIHRALTYHL